MLTYRLDGEKGGNMRHQRQEQLKAKRIAIAEAVIKNLIRQDKIKRAIDICEEHKISAKRFGELTKIALS